MFLKYQLLTDALGNEGIPPKIMTPDAACADLFLPKEVIILSGEYVTIPLLIAFDIPVDWCLYMQPRSSTFTKHGIMVPTGIIDSDYKGTVHLQAYNMCRNDRHFAVGTRLVQVQLFQKQRIQFERISLMPALESRQPIIGSTGV